MSRFPGSQKGTNSVDWLAHLASVALMHRMPASCSVLERTLTGTYSLLGGLSSGVASRNSLPPSWARQAFQIRGETLQTTLRHIVAVQSEILTISIQSFTDVSTSTAHYYMPSAHKFDITDIALCLLRVWCRIDYAV